MMPPQSSNDSTAKIAAAVVASNPVLRAKLERIVNRLFDHVDYTLKWGNDQDKSALMRAMIPTMLKALSTNEQDAATKAEREAFERMRQAIITGDANALSE